MLRAFLHLLPVLAVSAVPLAAQQTTNDPFPDPIPQDEPVVVDIRDFATLPDHAEGVARMMVLFDEPATERLFVNDMWGPIYSVSYDGSEVGLYVDIDREVGVEASGRERGFQSFAFHPEFGVEGADGYGKFYTWSDVRDNTPTADFRPEGGDNTHHTVLHEWTATSARRMGEAGAIR